MSGSCPTPGRAASKSFKLGFLTNVERYLLDAETGKLMEYRHLIKRPKYKDNWGYSFGNKIEFLAQCTTGRNIGSTTFLNNKEEVSADRWKDMTYGRTVCNIRP